MSYRYGRSRWASAISHLARSRFIREIPMSIPKQPWLGHYPITVFVLEALAKELSDNPASEPPRAEKVLFVACAFWAAVAMETLDDYLSGDMIDRLQSARAACVDIGATAVAAVLQRHLDDLPRYADELSAKRLVAGMQTELARAGDDMDELIAHYAANGVRDGILSG